MPPRSAPAHKHTKWGLLLNTFVEIRHQGQIVRTGTVEDVMPDSSALWLAADSSSPREMFEKCQDHEVWVTPQELSGDLHFRMTTRQIFGTPAGKR
jgi:hypothetical protein